ncbi:hypothetical protein BD779DRAFT_497447 [Infundibulicybe gibba]|nr:hypothetical protein BD779DRAFT_497447 [Infundibulicybe gibba]
MAPTPRTSRFSTDHLTQLITLAKGLRSMGDAWPFPGVKGSFEALVMVLELIQLARMNDDDIVYLANLVVDVGKILHQEITSNYRQRQLDANLIMLCDSFFRYLREVATDLNLIVTNNRSSWFRRYIQSAIIRKKIDDYTRRIKDLQILVLLSATTSTSFKTSNIHSDISILKKSLSDVRARLPDPDILPKKGVQNGRLDVALYEVDFLRFKRGELHLLYTSPMKTFLGNLEIKISPKHEAFRTRGTITSCGVSVPGSVHLKTIHIFEGDHASEVGHTFP